MKLWMMTDRPETGLSGATDVENVTAGWRRLSAVAGWAGRRRQRWEKFNET